VTILSGRRSAIGAATVRDRLSDPGAKARIAAQLIPPDIAEQVPLDLLGLIAGLPAETARIPWVGPSATYGKDWLPGVHARQLQHLVRRRERDGTPG